MSNDDVKPTDDLVKAIKRLIAFFDLFEYPLSPLEMWHYLDQRFSLGEIMIALEQLPPTITQENGFYFLTGRQETLKTRQQRYNYSQRKLRIAKRFSRLFILFPFVKAVTIANSLGAYNLRDGSDIDFFIITAPRRAWLSRLFCAGLAKLFNRRPSAGNKKDKLCLSFYVDAEHLNMSRLHLPVFDPYFFYWQRSLVLLYNKDKHYQKFLAANALLPNLTEVKTAQPKKLTRLGDYLEKMVKQWQLKIMPVNLLSQSQIGEGVVLEEGIIKLYLLDRRQEFLKKYEEKIESLA
jgi:hypothetical protein